MKQNSGWKDYFYFNARDRLAAFVIILLTLVVYFIPELFPSEEAGDWNLELGNRTLEIGKDSVDALASAKDEEWSKTERAGQEDERGIYRDHQYPYWKENHNASTSKFQSPSSKFQSPNSKFQSPNSKFHSPASLSVNSADSAAWESLPGIGEKLAMRICKFRESLGGFYSIDQVGETFGLKDSVFQKIRPLLKMDGSVKKIAINKAEKERLSSHPYIRYKGAALIENYRNQHGAIHGIDELKQLPYFTTEVLDKLKHYLDFTE